MFRTVYKCVCYADHRGWELHTALLKHMETRAGEWVERLDSAEDTEWVELYRTALQQFTLAIKHKIVHYFSYLDSRLVKAVLHTTLQTQLVETVGCLVSQRQIQRLMLHTDTIREQEVLAETDFDWSSVLQ